MKAAKMEYHRAIISLLLIFTTSLADERFIVHVDLEKKTSLENKNNNKTVVCEQLHQKIDIREVLGQWQVIEMYLHLSKEGVNRYLSCPKVTIWQDEKFPTTTYGPSTENQLFHVQHINAKFRQEYRHLRLLWDEAGNTIEYSLYFRNDSAGYWQVFNPQNGTVPNLHRYHQFSGTIQVLKAVNDHLVLNFCQDAVNGRTAQLYSILLTREPGYMERWELESVHGLLQNKKLSIASRRMVCGNSADKPMYSAVSSIIILLLTFVIGSC